MNFTDLKKIYYYMQMGISGIKDGYIYPSNRYKELINKGFTPKQTKDLINFELGLKFSTSTIGKAASKGACFSAGAEVGATAGLAVAGPTGVIPGAGIGGLGGLWVCGQTIDYATEKSIQHLSESLWSEFKQPQKLHIDLNKAGMYITGNDPYISATKPRDAFIYNEINNKLAA